MKLQVYRGLFRKILIIEIACDNATKLLKLAKYYDKKGRIKNPQIDFVDEVIALNKKGLIINFYIGKKVLEKENLEDSNMHVNTGAHTKHIWHRFLTHKKNGKTTLLLHGSND